MNVVLYNCLTVDVLRVYIKWNFKSHFLSVVFSYTQFPFYHNKLHIYPEVPILRASLQMKITILLKSKNFIMNINHNLLFLNKLINLLTFRYCHLQSINSSRKKTGAPLPGPQFGDLTKLPCQLNLFSKHFLFFINEALVFADDTSQGLSLSHFCSTMI